MNKILKEAAFVISLIVAATGAALTYLGGLDTGLVEPETVAVIGGINVVAAAILAVVVGRIEAE